MAYEQFEKVKLDKEHVEAQAARDELRLGWYPFLARKFQLRANEETGHQSLGFQLAPMEDPEDASSAKYPTMFGDLDLADGAFNSKKAEKFLVGKTTALGAAMFDDVPGLPVKRGKTYFVGGVELAKGAYEPAVRAATLGVQTKIEKIWNEAIDSGGASLAKLNNSMVVYAEVVINEYDNREGVHVIARQLDHFARELPPNTALVPAGQFVDDGEQPTGVSLTPRAAAASTSKEEPKAKAKAKARK
jgi:hypothetical protein